MSPPSRAPTGVTDVTDVTDGPNEGWRRSVDSSRLKARAWKGEVEGLTFFHDERRSLGVFRLPLAFILSCDSK